MKTESIITRFAPSPTGNLHLGGARTALFNYLFTAKQNGRIILRIDDTDNERSRPEYEESIKSGLAWLGLSFDQEIKQSERTDIYRRYLKQLLAGGQAYVSTDEGGREPVIRFKNPNRLIRFTDLIRGNIEFDTSDLGDFVIAKDENRPLYHLASVIDDRELGITHIIRGEDHISNTPRQILITEALAVADEIKPTVAYAHIPLILAPDRSKLSKRHGAVDLRQYREQGYLPEAMINFLASLGWSAQAGKEGTNQEIFTLTELTKLFSLDGIQKSGAVFNQDKLDWFNREQIKRLPADELFTQIKNQLPENIFTRPTYSDERLRQIIPLITERITVFNDIRRLAEEGEYDFYFSPPGLAKEMLGPAKYLAQTKEIIDQIDKDDFTAEVIKDKLWDFATANGRGEVLWPLRVALTGREKSPDPFTVAAIIGKEETLSRISYALTL
ncbi:MAG: glutamate--tRNA ligase family protein [Candidatus Paceibacterota bacterium]